jgi:hypothetical protein
VTDVLALDDRWATISTDGRYRYELGRRWGSGPTALWVMLNPSTADAVDDDNTIRRCIGFSKREGCGGLVVVNLFAYRATDPDALLTVADPIGPDNASTIKSRLADPLTAIVVAAWGAWHNTQAARRTGPGTARLNVEQFARDAGHDMVCLGLTKAGAPRHPLYVKTSQPFVPFQGAAA